MTDDEVGCKMVVNAVGAVERALDPRTFDRAALAQAVVDAGHLIGSLHALCSPASPLEMDALTAMIEAAVTIRRKVALIAETRDPEWWRKRQAGA